MDVYKMLVILDSSGLSGESVCVEYNTLSVHEGIRVVLKKRSIGVSDKWYSKSSLLVLVHFPKFVLIAALEPPKIALLEANESVAFLSFNEQLIILLKLLPQALAIQRLCDLSSLELLCERVFLG